MLTRWGRELDRDRPLPEHPRPQLVARALGQPERPLGARLHRDGRAARVVRRGDRGPVLAGGIALRGRAAAPARRVALVPTQRHRTRSSPGRAGAAALRRRRPVLHGLGQRHRESAPTPAATCRSRSTSPTSCTGPATSCSRSASGTCPRPVCTLAASNGSTAARSGTPRSRASGRRCGSSPSPRRTSTRLVVVPHLDIGALEVTVHAVGSGRPRRSRPTWWSRRARPRCVVGRRRPPGEPVLVPLSEVRPWSPDDPHLYDLEVTLGEDRVTSFAGLRSFGVGADARGPAALPAQRRAGRARRRARPGLLARRAAHRHRATRRWCTTSSR